MTERVRLTLGGRHVEADADASLLAALWNHGARAVRTSVSGAVRGPLCAMGTCFECRVTVDGEPHVRACLTPVREGMTVALDALAPPGGARSQGHAPALEAAVVVVGGGPAGLAAAVHAAEAGARTLLVDTNARPGGQIWRHRGEPPRAARAWLARFARSGASAVTGATVVDATEQELLIEDAGRARRVRFERLVLATGARELFLPFPGWTLPGVVGVGGAQALVKAGARVAGRRVVVAGSSPLLLAVAAALAAAGARVVGVAEQAPLERLLAFGASLWRTPSKIAEGLGYAAADRRARAIVPEPGCARPRSVAARSARRSRTAAATGPGTATCSRQATAWCRTWSCRVWSAARCAKGAWSPTGRSRRASRGSTPRASSPASQASSTRSGAARWPARPPRDARYLLRPWSGATASSPSPLRLARAFALREELRRLPRSDTLVCRCEDVGYGRLEGFGSAREAKLATRAGMGACQGRVCGPALGFLHGWEDGSVRAPPHAGPARRARGRDGRARLSRPLAGTARLWPPGRLRRADGAEIGDELGRVAMAVAGLLLQAAARDPGERGRGQPRRVQSRRRIAQDRGHRLGAAVLVERPLTRQHLDQHGSEGEQVRTRVERSGSYLLRRHVGHRPDELARHREGARPRRRSGARRGERLAMPKSRILTSPDAVMNRFSGFRSRWTMPWSCTARRPAAMPRAYSMRLAPPAAVRA